MSRRQLHEALEMLGAEPVRACGMEARDIPQHRTKVKPRKAGLTWVSVLADATPDFQPWQDGIEDGGGGTLLTLTPGDLPGSVWSGRRRGDAVPKPEEKSDHPIRALKSGNADRAKGVTV